MDFLREAFRGGNRFVVRLALIAALGGFLFGYDTGVISGALLYIEPAFHPSSFEAQAFVGALLIGAMVGAVLSGWSATALSRRRTKIVSGSIYVLGALASAAAQSSWELIIARFVLGVAVGAASFVSPMYISELAPKKIRGGVTSFNQLMVVSGIFVAYIVNWALGGITGNWRWMLGLAALPGAAPAVGMYFQPYSPRWLSSKGREDEAREVLRRARESDEEVDEELEEIEEEASRKADLRDLWASNFLVATFFLTLTGAITIEGTFWLYAGFGIAAVLFFFFRLPETKNRSLEEISDEVVDEAVGPA